MFYLTNVEKRRNIARAKKKKLFSYSAIQNRDFIKKKPKKQMLLATSKKKKVNIFLRPIDLVWNPEIFAM